MLNKATKLQRFGKANENVVKKQQFFKIVVLSKLIATYLLHLKISYVMFVMFKYEKFPKVGKA